MALEPTALRSRRAVLGASIGGLVTLAASALGRAAPVRAGVDGDVTIGASSPSTATTGVYNQVNNNNVFSAASVQVGVGTGGGIGLEGSSEVGTGVHGTAGAGVGVHADASSSGTALRVDGRASFSRAGRANVAAGKSYVDVVPPGGLGGSPNIVATLQAYRSGVWVAAVRRNYPSTGKARIYLNKVASSTSLTPVAWFVFG